MDTRTKKPLIFLLTVILFLVAGCETFVAPPTATPMPFDRGFEVTEVPFGIPADWSQIEFVPNPDIDRQLLVDAVFNLDQSLALYNPCTPGPCRIVFEETATNQLYELTGPFLPWRPISRQVWLNNDIVGFDIWSNPHYGFHYEIDFTHREVIYISNIHD